ncbi:hypothetical protein ES319_A13G185500v1 [Gossypium barbadense]|uniref:Uncharacterized protein n=2 Tax=Gossypium TaxID=3633 RepID=A0A5J5T437_GOSBA|nr:hypothetical protein ES319_A13G185500v1 [Gossypium barbadense]TYG87235.1 hypothetical protein ES288_A13G197500v1 [Gossypium darwinii]
MGKTDPYHPSVLSLSFGFWPQPWSATAPPSDLVADYAQKGHDERPEFEIDEGGRSSSDVIRSARSQRGRFLFWCKGASESRPSGDVRAEGTLGGCGARERARVSTLAESGLCFWAFWASKFGLSFFVLGFDIFFEAWSNLGMYIHKFTFCSFSNFCFKINYFITFQVKLMPFKLVL